MMRHQVTHIFRSSNTLSTFDTFLRVIFTVTQYDLFMENDSWLIKANGDEFDQNREKYT